MRYHKVSAHMFFTTGNSHDLELLSGVSVLLAVSDLSR